MRLDWNYYVCKDLQSGTDDYNVKIMLLELTPSCSDTLSAIKAPATSSQLLWFVLSTHLFCSWYKIVQNLWDRKTASY